MRRRRKYDQAFKDEAVQLLLHSGKSIREVSEDLDVEHSNLSRWRREYLERLDREGTGAAGQPKASELEKENRRLRRELAQVVHQRDILKKAVGICSRDPERYTGS